MSEVSHSGTARVVLLCGVAGAGKTTYARTLEARGWSRLSVDAEVWALQGAHAADDDPVRVEALARVERRLVDLLRAGADVVLDLSLWRRADRDRYKQLVERHGGRWSLVYLTATEAVLRQRLRDRSDPGDPDAADVPDDLLAQYLAGFSEPQGEGETPPWDDPQDACWKPA